MGRKEIIASNDNNWFRMEGIKNGCKMKRHRANTGNTYVMKRKNKLVLNKMGMRLNPNKWEVYFY